MYGGAAGEVENPHLLAQPSGLHVHRAIGLWTKVA
jgi:hypothetical protein